MSKKATTRKKPAKKPSKPHSARSMIGTALRDAEFAREQSYVAIEGAKQAHETSGQAIDGLHRLFAALSYLADQMAGAGVIPTKIRDNVQKILSTPTEEMRRMAEDRREQEQELIEPAVDTETIKAWVVKQLEDQDGGPATIACIMQDDGAPYTTQQIHRALLELLGEDRVEEIRQKGGSDWRLVPPLRGPRE